MTPNRLLRTLALAAALSGGQALAQAPSFYLTPIGAPVSLETAKKAAAAVMAEARKHGWLMAVAVVDPNGTLVYFERMDNVQIAAIEVAQDKARASAIYKRPTKLFQDGVAGGGAGLRLLGLRGASPIEGGVPLVMGGKLVGAIGTSGDAGENDAVCANAGAAAVKIP